MRVVAAEDAAAVGRAAADLVIGGLREAASPVLGVATGSSPVTTYEALARRRDELPVGLVLALLDEYIGLPPAHPARYRSVITDMAATLGVPPTRVRAPDVDVPDLDAASTDYECELSSLGGIDVQVLGLGANGHIGFNEPGAAASSTTRVVELAAATRASNARFFGGEPAHVPTHAITLGLATILSARAIIVVVSGRAKAEVLAELLDGADSTLPAHALRDHGDATIVAARSALAGHHRAVS